ncbi:MAG: DUF928 domain-containing protein [Symploca sp. SIO1C2]|nr:DUF928 domain-containing protein [Symploca sp. SIO1C2]
MWFLNKYIKAKLITSSILGLSLLITPAALADYKPPAEQKSPSDYTRQGGSRDGCAGEGMPLTALVPLTHVGQTISTRPTFAWIVPDSTTKQMKLSLYEYDSEGIPQQMGDPIVMDLNSSGIMTFTLQENRPELKVGNVYLWQVAIICDPYNPSSDLIVSADILVVEKPLDWENMLLDRSTASDASDFYADKGLWYDALSQALKLAEESKLGEVGSSLLEDLAELEAAKLTDEDRKNESVKDFRRIADSLR